jgi:hypothetical protein
MTSGRFGLALLFFGLITWIARRTPFGIFANIPDLALQAVALLFLFGLALVATAISIRFWNDG